MEAMPGLLPCNAIDIQNIAFAGDSDNFHLHF